MNPDTTEQNINQAIDWLQKTGWQIQDFAAEQAPLYCREVVAWELWSGAWTAIAGVLLAIIAAWLLKLMKRLAYSGKSPFNEDEFHPDGIFPAMAAICAIVAALVCISVGVPQAIKAAVAPRLIIVEHLRGIQK